MMLVKVSPEEDKRVTEFMDKYRKMVEERNSLIMDDVMKIYNSIDEKTLRDLRNEWLLFSPGLLIRYDLKLMTDYEDENFRHVPELSRAFEFAETFHDHLGFILDGYFNRVCEICFDEYVKIEDVIGKDYEDELTFQTLQLYHDVDIFHAFYSMIKSVIATKVAQDKEIESINRHEHMIIIKHEPQKDLESLWSR